jgi:hypothetical protein
MFDSCKNLRPPGASSEALSHQETPMTFTTRYGFGILIDATTGMILRSASRDELIATIPAIAGKAPQTIKVDIDGTTYECTVKYQQ